MKAELTELSETRKRLDVEIPAARVDETLARLAQRYARRAKVSGFRPGKVPVHVVRQRFKQDLLHDVAHDLVPPAVDEALREQSLTPVDTPDVRDISIDEGKPLSFHALFEVMPSIADLEYDAMTLRRTPVVPDAEATNKALDELRRRASKLEPVSERAVEATDVVTLDIARRGLTDPDHLDTSKLDASKTDPPEDRHEDVTIELGAAANPPGFDDELLRMEVGQEKSFELSYPTNHEQAELAGTNIAYEVTLRAIHRRVVPALNDEFAKTVGDFDSLDTLRERVGADLEKEAAAEADRSLRRDLMSQLSAHLTVEVPEALVRREIGRRLEQLANQLAQQRVDPKTANIDWDALREEQRAPALETVRGSIVLDEVARREVVTVSDDEVDQEITRHAERLGQTPTAVRAQLEKDDALAAISEGMRREKTIKLLLSRATIVTA